jgi:redox-sensing transcriptional repressor
VAGFDIDASKHQREAEVPILPLDELIGFVGENGVRIGIICVPDAAAQEIVELMLSAGIRGVLNFAPICLKEPEGCVVRNLNLETELENIIYFSVLAEKEEATR